MDLFFIFNKIIVYVLLILLRKTYYLLIVTFNKIIVYVLLY